MYSLVDTDNEESKKAKGVNDRGIIHKQLLMFYLLEN